MIRRESHDVEMARTVQTLTEGHRLCRRPLFGDGLVSFEGYCDRVRIVA